MIILVRSLSVFYIILLVQTASIDLPSSDPLILMKIKSYSVIRVSITGNTGIFVLIVYNM